MNLAAVKLELAKRIIDTDDIDTINKVLAIFKNKSDNWLNELPAEIAASVERSLKQSAKGQTISHNEAMQSFEKWQKK